MEHGAISYLPLLIIILLATFVPVVVKKMKYLPIPIVVGEIITGMIVGKSGFNLIDESPWLNFLYTFGFAFLMFLSGLEIDFKLMGPAGKTLQSKWYKKPLFFAITIFLATLALSGAIVYTLKVFGFISNIPLMTLILSTTSLGIVVPTLKEKKLLNTAYGQCILLSSLIADFATMVLITVFVTLYTSKGAYEVLLVLLLFVAFFVFYKMGLKIVSNKIIEELSHATSQIKVRGAFALILIFIALAQSLGTEIILGAFLAGVIVSLLNNEDHTQLTLKLDAIGYGFFIPIFFIMVGANFDLQSVMKNPKSLYLLPILIIAVYVVKCIPALILKINYSWKETVAGGFILSSRLSLIIAASAIGLKLGIISTEVNGAIILVAIITCTVSPLLFNHFSPKANVSTKKDIYILGINGKTLLLAKRLKKSEGEVIFITQEREEYEKRIKGKEKAYLGDFLDIDFLESTGIKNAKTVVVANSIEEKNTEICRICSEIFGINHIVLLTNSQSTPEGAQRYGAMAVSPEFATVFMAENFITHPKAFCLLFEEQEDDFAIAEVYLKNPHYFERPIRKLQLPGDCLILSILRKGEKIIPHGNNILQSGDLIMVVGARQYVKQAEWILGNE